MMPHRRDSSDQRAEQNCEPQSEVRWSGTPKQATHPETKAAAMVAVSVLVKGMASSHLEERSTMVRI